MADARTGVRVMWPSRNDPRLKLSAVIMTLQVLGQTVLDWKVSIAQILVSIGVCAVIEIAVTYRRDRVVAWPASAILTGNSVAFILRASGTQHGDWWSLNGIEYFVFACLLSLLSKYLIRPGGRHLFNPSNVGLVLCLLLIGPGRVFPQYLYWGGLRSGEVVLAMVVILLGAIWVLRPVRMVPMAVAFLVTFAALVAVFAAGGRSFVAIWAAEPISGFSYWRNICLSPELLIFVFFMMSDPQTAPKTQASRVIYGAATAVLAGGLVFFQDTEFGIKLGILASLTVVCALVPILEKFGAQVHVPRERPLPRGRGHVTRAPAAFAAVVIVIAAAAGTAALASDEQVILIERGQSSPQ